MPTARGRGAARKQRQPRRTHNLGGCSTCRRRHVKCDQNRPQCTTCSNAGLECGGFPSSIRWASTYTPSRAPKADERRPETPLANHHIYQRTQNAQPASQASPPEPTLLSTIGGQDSSYTYVSNSSIDFQDMSPAQTRGSSNIATDPSTTTVDIPGSELPFALIDETDVANQPTHESSDLDSLFDASGGLGWNDLFDPTFDFSEALTHDEAYGYGDALSLLAHVANQPQDQISLPQFYGNPITPNFEYEGVNTGTTTASIDLQPSTSTANEIEEPEVLEYAKVLLKHFRDILIPQFAPLPMSSKSPWEILIWSNAVQTHAHMTFLESPHIKHANKANFFAVLGCAAHSIAKTQLYSNLLPHQKVTQILEETSRRAKVHMQESLKLETSGQSKAKYKDQLMAIFSLIALATMSGNQSDARCYLIDAERLLRLRGLAKREVSRRARLLHHVYTWLRIIGESTFTLYDHNNSGLQTRIEKSLRANTDSSTNIAALGDRETSGPDEHFQLDDFLRVRTHGTDSDSDAEAPKDPEFGLRDIHLEDLRQWSKTLYMDIYGIPEIWLSLVSQTTRLANIMEFVDKSSLHTPRLFTSSLQRKVNRLEHVICSFAAKHSISRSPSPPVPGENTRSGPATPKPPQASRAMLRAMSSALVIFFYRRIRRVHPWILRGHVNDTMTALKDFDTAQDGRETKAPGTPWPAFIAGCEAMSPSSQEWFANWMRKGAAESAFNGFTASQQIMREVWERRDAAENSSGKGRGGGGTIDTARGEIYSWVDVLREGKYWLMLY